MVLIAPPRVKRDRNCLTSEPETGTTEGRRKPETVAGCRGRQPHATVEQLKPLLTQASYPIENERRSLHRFPLPSALPIEVRWRDRALALNRDSERENISGSGLCFCLKEGEPPPLGAELEVRMSLRDYMFQSTGLGARCRGRVVRHDTQRRVVVEFSDILLEPTEGRRGMPFLATRPGNGNGNGNGNGSHPHFSPPIVKMR